ncbi:uncharacterized protein TRUGW13939_09192 [Talaromyces rugulosus]|uniref:DUF6593 domain-containing protein n=1 Tax=Talaromyces rugulosus TaxID=121627 RepID=A0A7H8R753_TALRU|nr:uncharacterized protein TRUGW13939_09192 [Talaromyces rugulosus]QKX62036.1 hypothetical protein TRUGW13939_09192 [Talaromyces rugulosus]
MFCFGFDSNNTPQPVFAFIFDTKSNTFLAPGPYGQYIPAFTIKSSPKTKPNMTVYRIGQNGSMMIGTCTTRTSSLSGNVYAEVSLYGRSFKMKHDQLTGSSSQKFEYPSLGSFKWKPDLKGELRLFDGNGQLLARWQKSGQNQKLDFYVSGQGELVDMVVVTALAAMDFQHKEGKQVEEVMDALDVISALS